MKKNIIGLIVILLVGIGGFYYIENSCMKLKAETIKLEYGKTISTNAEEYLDLKHVKNKKSFLEKCVVEKPKALIQGKQYEAIGSYDIKIKRGVIERKVVVEIKDTTPPKIECNKECSLTVGKKLDLKKKIKVSDLSKYEVKIDDDKVDYKKSGTYIVNIVAVDEYNNKASKEVLIRIKENKSNNTNNNYKDNNTYRDTKKNQSHSNKSNNNKNNNNSNENNEEEIIAEWTEDDNVKCTGTHDGFKPLYGGWSNSASQLEEWAFEYLTNYDSDISTYGIHYCTKCEMMCISEFS